MAEFVVTSPDGRKFKVQAPDRATAVQRVQSSLGTMPSAAQTAETPGAVAPAETRALIPAAEFEGKQPGDQFMHVPEKGVYVNLDHFIDKQRERDGPLQTARELGSQLFRGYLGVGSRLDEAVQSQDKTGLFSPLDTEAMGLPKDATGQIVKRYQSRTQEEAPLTSMGLNLTGGVLSALPAMATAPALVPQMASPLVKTAATAGILGTGGALESAAYQTGEDENTASDVTEAGIRGGLLSGVLGAASAPLALLGGSITRTAKDAFTGPGRELGDNTIARALGPVLEADADGLLNRLDTAGPRSMLMDAGPTANRLTEMIAKAPGPGAPIVRQASQQRVDSLNQEIRDYLASVGVDQPNLPAVPGQSAPLAGRLSPRQMARENARATAPQRKAAYDAFYSTPVDYAGEPGQRILRLIDAVGPRARREKA